MGKPGIGVATHAMMPDHPKAHMSAARPHGCAPLAGNYGSSAVSEGTLKYVAGAQICQELIASVTPNRVLPLPLAARGNKPGLQLGFGFGVGVGLGLLGRLRQPPSSASPSPLPLAGTSPVCSSGSGSASESGSAS